MAHLRPVQNKECKNMQTTCSRWDYTGTTVGSIAIWVDGLDVRDLGIRLHQGTGLKL